MKIKEIHIYGFGKWKDYSIKLENGQFTLVTGRNEAGKSTLYQFILFIFFGLSPKEREFYRPKSGGSVGGKLIVSTYEYGDVGIERLHEKENGKVVCRMQDGREEGEEWLKDQLGRMNRDVYDAIYSFSAEDLTNLNQLKGSEIGEVLLNIGMTGSEQIYQTEKWLDKMSQDRFKPKGRKPEINQQLQIVEELYRKQAVAEKEEGSYQELKSDLIKWTEQVREMSEEISARRNEQYNLEQMIKALPLVHEFHQLKAEMNQSNDDDSFPEEARERYQQLKEAILPLESEKQVTRTKYQEWVSKQQAIKQQLASEKDCQEVESLLERQPDFERASNQVEQWKERRAELQERIEYDRKQMQVPIQDDEWNDYSFPFFVEETWSNLKEEANKIDQEEERLDEWESDLKVDKQSIYQRKESLAGKMMDEEKARSYSEQLTMHGQAGASSHAETSEQLLKVYRLVWILFTFILFTAGWTIALLASLVVIGLIATLMSALTAFGAYWSHRSLQKEALVKEQAVTPVQPLSEIQQKLSEHEKDKAERAQLEKQARNADLEEIRLEERRRHLNQRKKRLETGIQEQETLYPFLTSLSIDHWDKLYHWLTQAKQKWSENEKLEQSIREHEEWMHHVIQDVKRFYERMNWESDSKEAHEFWRELRNWANQQLQLQNELASITEQISRTEKQLKDTNARLHSYYEKRQELFNQADVPSEEAFYFRLKQTEILKEQWERRHSLIQQISRLLSEKEQKQFAVWHDPPSESALQLQWNSTKEKMQERENEQRDLQQQVADKRSKLRTLESSGQYSELFHHYEAERSKLKELAIEWAKYQLAWHVVHKTKEKYKQTYLPQVLKQAEKYFFRLTSGKYTAVRLFEDREALRVEDHKGQVYEVFELSRGTRDQLYVSLRLSLGKTMAETARLPFLLDDAFVHFDQKRLPVMLQIIEEMSNDHQIILFTWRSDLAGSFQKVMEHKL
ncbi:AAA family ATPase [Halobacillus sp. K22]|uniref:ATP-binding protein n=1 Tax=Halobacillus sp. K22 TaxID=3457431 RepID=UPI003FCC7C6B